MPRDREPGESEARDIDRLREQEARRGVDPREVFSRDLNLPSGLRRERIGNCRLRASEVRTLATVGAFRVVREDDLQRLAGSGELLSKDVEPLRQAGLVSTSAYVVGRERCPLVSLTDQGRAVLESSRGDRNQPRPQAFYVGSTKRELAHDSRLLPAYLDAAERLARDGCRIQRVTLDRELKREYQSFLQDPNRRRRGATGQPRRDREAIARWAEEHGLPVIDDSVKFPDFRIEYDRPDGEAAHQDIEVVTPNYRGSHASAKVSAGFTCYQYGSARVGGAGSSGRGGRGRESRLAEEMLH